ncbi:UvrD-helicase domain-containing protein, partial [Burkholderia cenocepacia]
RALDLPPDIHAWSIDRGPDCYTDLARRVRLLLDRSAALTGALAERYPIIVCDEHQDASNDQQGIVDALSRAGARLRFFGDPMQAIFAAGVEREALQLQWRRLVDEADSFERLDT